jgi:RimJ/RimL family protein N-acetyltransferase
VTTAATVTLRPYAAGDTALHAGVESEFEDFGPRGLDPTRQLPGANLDDRGGMVVCEADRAVGSLSWHYTQWGPTAGSRCVMIGIGLVTDARGRGIGTRAQELITELLFTHTRVNRVEAATEVTNLAEQRSLEKAGFTREGVIRGSIWRRGEFRDQYLYSRLRDDPTPPGPTA